MVPETTAMAEMKQIFMGAAQLASMEESDEKGNPVPPNFDLQKMAERGLIPQYLALSRRGPYIYTIRSKGYEFEVLGDPVDPKSSLRHFMIDSDGAFHAERGRPATQESPVL